MTFSSNQLIVVVYEMLPKKKNRAHETVFSQVSLCSMSTHCWFLWFHISDIVCVRFCSLLSLSCTNHSSVTFESNLPTVGDDSWWIICTYKVMNEAEITARTLEGREELIKRCMIRKGCNTKDVVVVWCMSRPLPRNNQPSAKPGNMSGQLCPDAWLRLSLKSLLLSDQQKTRCYVEIWNMWICRHFLLMIPFLVINLMQID